MIAQKKAKAFLILLLKELLVLFNNLYIVLFGLAFWQINTLIKN